VCVWGGVGVGGGVGGWGGGANDGHIRNESQKRQCLDAEISQ
jgi:hypothetical protein